MSEEPVKCIIGRRDMIDFPELGLQDIEAKIDTGAYTSAIHCSQIKLVTRKGIKKISFHILGTHQTGVGHRIFSTANFKEKKIRSSFGQVEKRFVIKTKIKMFGKVFRAEFSLSDRTEMRFPVLLGRKLLRNRFMVDVSLYNLSYNQKNKSILMRIAILSRNANLYSTKRLVEAARQRGHEVSVLDHLKCYVVIERGNPVIYYNGKVVPKIDAIIPRIGNSVTLYGTAIVRQFEIMQVFSAVKSLAIVRSRDKLRSLQILSKAGVGLPKTAFANHTRDIEGVLVQVGGTPVVIKLLEGTQGIGVMLAESPKAAKSIIEAFYGMKADILIQEFIKEAAGADIRAFVVDGKVVGAMKRQGKDGEFRSNLHRGGDGVIIKLSKQEKETALAAANALGLAVAGVDMLQSNRGPLVMEVNSSPGLQGIETATKVDIAGKIIQYIEKNIKVNIKDKVGV